MWLNAGHGATEVVVSCSCLVLASAHLLFFKSLLSHDSPVSCAAQNLSDPPSITGHYEVHSYK